MNKLANEQMQPYSDNCWFGESYMTCQICDWICEKGSYTQIQFYNFEQA